MIGIVTLNDTLEYEVELDDQSAFVVGLNDQLVFRTETEELP